MITFKEYLNEAKHRSAITVDEAIAMIKEHCKDMDIEQPFWRGSRQAYEPAYLIHGELGTRKSKNSKNYYTLIMDHFLPAEGYPLRSKSIIFGNHSNLEYVRGFGSVYAIFPFDGEKIGVCEGHDFWETKFRLNPDFDEFSPNMWNHYYKAIGLSDDSYQDFKNSLISAINDPQGAGSRMMHDIFDGSKNVEQVLKKGYSPENLSLKLCTSKDVPEDHGREMWTSGKCIAISQDLWEKAVYGKSND